MGHHEQLEQAELALIGAALTAGSRITGDVELDPADFANVTYEHLWRIVQDMHRDGTPVDPLSVWNRATKAGVQVDIANLHRAVEVAPPAASMGHYASIVAEGAARRRLALAGGKIREMAGEAGDVQAIIEDARALLDKSAKINVAENVAFAWETMADTVSRLDEAETFTPTPWQALNDIIGGLRPGALYTVGARPGVGKSVIGVQLGLELARHGGVAMLSLEMSLDDVNRRILAHQCHVPLNRLTTPHALTNVDRERVQHWLANNRLPFAVHKSAQVSLTDVRRFARSVDRRAPLAGIVVDYLQLMAQAPQDKRARHEFVADMSRGLKLLALDMNVPVIMLSQLNRLSTAREDKRPMLSDLRESGAIEQDSDVVLLLHRDTTDPDRADRLELLVAKNRHGRPGTCELNFAGHYSEARD